MACLGAWQAVVKILHGLLNDNRGHILSAIASALSIHADA
jgi:hypothetical protein